MSKKIFIFGNAAQDIIVEADLERLQRESKEVYLSDLIRLNNELYLKEGLYLKTEIGLTEYMIKVDLKEKNNLELVDDKKFYKLDPGGKYSLVEEVRTLSKEEKILPAGANVLSVNCTAKEWGGGGLNMCKFLRSLAPSEQKLSITYLDIAMTSGLHSLIDSMGRVFESSIPEDNLSIKNMLALLENLAAKNPAQVEKITTRLAKIAANHSSAHFLEVYLASHHVDTVLFRPQKPNNRRNWVFRNVKSGKKEISNKIVCRGKIDPLTKEEEQQIQQLFNMENEDIGAICLNSIKNPTIFHAAYQLYKQKYAQDKNSIICVMAMTTGMQEHTNALLKDKEKDEKNSRRWPPFILVFNEKEIVSFVEKINKAEKKEKYERIEFWPQNEMPDVHLFAKLIDRIWSQFKFDEVPRIYVTLGQLGSLGFDGHSNNIVYVSAYSDLSSIYDTTGCGDAYCATITLLEWAKQREEYKKIGEHFTDGNPQQHSLENAQEMEYFMAVANAASFCKATSPTGRINRNKLKDLLEHKHLACGFNGNIKDFLEKNTDHYPDWVDKKGRLIKPSKARQIKASEPLKKLLSIEDNHPISDL